MPVQSSTISICDECTSDSECGGGRQCVPATTPGFDAIPIQRCVNAGTTCAAGTVLNSDADDVVRCGPPPTPCMLP